MSINKKSVSHYDYIIGYASYFKYLITAFLRYRKTYRNYIIIITDILRKKYPIEATLRIGGDHITLHNHFEVFFISILQGYRGVKYDIIDDRLTISLPSDLSDDGRIAEVKLQGSINNGDV